MLHIYITHLVKNADAQKPADILVAQPVELSQLKHHVPLQKIALVNMKSIF
jgi:hypothetical protein